MLVSRNYLNGLFIYTHTDLPASSAMLQDRSPFDGLGVRRHGLSRGPAFQYTSADRGSHVGGSIRQLARLAD